MKQIMRVGDFCTGHQCWTPRPCVQGSDNIFMDGKRVHRGGDRWAVHCRPCRKRRHCHAGVLKNASVNVFANGRKLGRTGDPVSCGSRCARGSSSGFCGG